MVPGTKSVLAQLASQIIESPTEKSYTDEELDERFQGTTEDRLHKIVISMDDCIKKLSLSDNGEKAVTERDMALAQLKRLKRLKSKAWLEEVHSWLPLPIRNVTYAAKLHSSCSCN